MTHTALLAALALFSLSACAQQPSQVRQPVEPAEPATFSEVEREQLIRQLLIGEIAEQRGDLNLAAEAYADLARKTRDVRVVKRALEMTSQARRVDLALGMARLLVELEPESVKARQYLVSLLVSGGRLKEAKPQIAALITLQDRAVADVFTHLNSMLSRQKDRQAVLELVRELAADHPALPEAQMAVARAAASAGDKAATNAALDAALKLKPGWILAAEYRGQLLQAEDEAAALDYWQGFLEQFPDAQGIRLQYAKGLTRAGRYVEARTQFERLRADTPKDAEAAFAAGLLALQTGAPAVGEAHLKDALALDHPDPAMVRFYLGQANEDLKRYDLALDWYRQATDSTQGFEAQLKVAEMLSRLGKYEDARGLLKSIEAENEAQRVALIQAQSLVYRDEKQYERAMQVLDQGLAALPDSPELLYDRAMIAERMGRLDVLEADLRKLIALRPDNAHAYNALGYTLADRTERIEEALGLLRQAIKLAPEDPFIQDSLGWALFRAKQMNEAIQYLKQAYASRPDPEIAAHLGEALWQGGDTEAARKVWAEALAAHPDNEVLRSTKIRLDP